MKRKLNQDDVPEAVPTTEPSKPESSFSDFGLDSRILRSIREQKWAVPTPVQAKAIPLAVSPQERPL